MHTRRCTRASTDARSHADTNAHAYACAHARTSRPCAHWKCASASPAPFVLSHHLMPERPVNLACYWAYTACN
eukprot:1712668-Alexandrium_andersonii.AAC.1